ncbi:hypothetical protein NRB56_56300 [Nocardia sp. RB56]|uniref:DUF3558 domain-containing protein n=1 Tax=Nocardia aurantia TaxID=2585199 RepID=A0A7K0DWD0_9NOCA|nr:hypothetical protein [Nocardia aurantia]
MVAVAAIAVGLAGCASSGGTSPTGSTGTAPAAPAPADIGLCGSEDADDLDLALGVTRLEQISADPLRCAWTGAGDPATYQVVFEWFRGSSLSDRRDQVAGQVSTVSVSGRPGFAWSAPGSCEVAVDSGGRDFVDWTLAGADAARQCAALQQVAAATLAKAG